MPPRRNHHQTPNPPTVAAPSPIDTDVPQITGEQTEVQPERTDSEPVSSSNTPIPLPVPANASVLSTIPKSPDMGTTRTTADVVADSAKVEDCTTSDDIGFKLIDEALRDLRTGRHGLWIGNYLSILKNCEWLPQGSNNSFVLRWKTNCQLKPDNDSDEVLVCWIGQGSSDGATLSPDSGWNIQFKEADVPKRKRTLRVVRPQQEARIPLTMWDSQIQGARQLIDAGYRLTPGGAKAGTGYTFFEEENRCLRVRSPVFLPLSQFSNGDSDFDDPEADIPPSHRYDTWNFSSAAVREAFDRVKDSGFVPQVMEVYDDHDNLIHPNRVQVEVPGSIIIVYATMEKALFLGWKDGGGKKWQFYANLVKMQVLQRPSRVNLAPKRKLRIVGYGASGASGSSAV
ncbi:hypothetical protein RSOLAG22IIIB_06884 [Rhizoctonia solani]|uniref:Uncharacterized protein n=1 Tax=Rhizoctonia solani TaxID=456999 RepID=A0A0K6GH77_9AGAM|nr:hypothetical protein RSOLAG22IIIB_06884 [Rhizoctonia solani]